MTSMPQPSTIQLTACYVEGQGMENENTHITPLEVIVHSGTQYGGSRARFWVLIRITAGQGRPR